jgi:hypothetical protein
LIADLKPTDGAGSSDIKFTLNADIIHSIFTQYPGGIKLLNSSQGLPGSCPNQNE